MKLKLHAHHAILPIVCLLLTPWRLPAAAVHVRLIDTETARVTPAMVCISGSDNQVRLPPDGRVLTKPSTTREFYSGVEGAFKGAFKGSF